MINIIAAVGKNLELGKDGKLIWHIPDDLKYFKELTSGHVVVMGRHTFESIGKPLDNRINIVLTKNGVYDDVITFSDYKSILDINEAEVFIIGGAEVYKLFLEYAKNLYLTEIDDECPEADVYFPEFDKSLYDKKIISDNNYEGLNYSYVRYRKK